MADARPNRVIADIFDNQPSMEDGFATAQLAPGLGCTYTSTEQGGDVTPVSANSNSTRVVLVAPNSGQNPTDASDMSVSPIDDSFAQNEHTYTAGLLRYHQARCRLASSSTASVGDDVGWNSNAEISNVETDGTTALTTFVGRLVEINTQVSPNFDLGRVEFY